MNTQEILEKQRKYLWPNHILYYTEPLPLDHGDGTYVWDVEGRRYLDFFGGILTTSVGHNNPRVADAVRDQVGKLIHSSTLYPNANHVALAEKLAEITPGDLQMSYFTNSGSEADETAIVAAQVYTDNREIVALRHAYSGRTMLAMSVTAHAAWKLGKTFSPDIKHAINPYCYRCPLKLTYPSCGVACAQDIEEVIRTTTSGKIAAFMAEPIQGVGGFITPPPEYFKIAVEIARHYGGVFISDEVQTGFGRTGDPLVRYLPLGCGAGHHDDGQGDRQRPAYGKHHRHAAGGAVDGGQGADAEHLRRQPDLYGGFAGDDRGAGGRGAGRCGSQCWEIACVRGWTNWGRSTR